MDNVRLEVYAIMRGRVDFVWRVISLDEQTRTVTVAVSPDPDRYEWREIDGERFLYDRLDNACFPEQVFFDLMKETDGKPIYCQPAGIRDAQQYVRSRRPMIMTMLRGEEPDLPLQDKSDAFLDSLAPHELGFVIISVDIVNSTTLATELGPNRYGRLISTILYETSEVVPRFYGHVLKYMGDGLIAYLAEPSFILKHDLAIDCALTIRGLVYDALNFVLPGEGFPTIHIRTGLESGQAHVEAIGSPQTKRHKDIVGAVVNLAAKIQSIAKPGEILLGDSMEKNLHTMWRQICEPAELPPQWACQGERGEPYRVHRIKFAT